ncbi:glycosyltransferase [Flavilitoribacter nigricans]|uniref:Glycosyltransferase subfamily 4-like N-terminal domain-containing protein n=1 Tax=Flavilitoribacter nigricans (strain ATCC 23147 / DSM 23189 / NBRC 102662 / NCIMB 1420 / SS-2) TaxID=1122177 RepID=A0A2D0MY49_FLAN2|nr:glycosyltransferase family 4 protein [Flavilitoribacter nigricans]PHN00819.1 hypothetical protein CRP01_40240 [Flavilitoribacter nigricans DSM 23189 = NBRC 102662]
MNILLTNIWLDGYAGTEVYIRDLAIALHRRGIHVEVYSPNLGRVAEEIRRAGIHIVSSVNQLVMQPDLIHAHHFMPTMDVLLRYKDVPAVYFQHDRTHPVDTPPRYNRIIQYVAVDYNCLDRLIIDNGIPESESTVLYNWVDTARFTLRTNFSDRPRRALVFSNYANPKNYYPVVREACQEMGIELDAVGKGMGNEIKEPEKVLGEYDIVFAKAKAAMEALASGAFVIVCDKRGLGGAVTTENFQYYRKFNFGMKTLSRPHEVNLIVEEINKYKAEEVKAVAHLIRTEASFDSFMDRILNLYHEVINKYYQKGFRENKQNEKTLEKYIDQMTVQFRQVIRQKNEELAGKDLIHANHDSLLAAKDRQLAQMKEDFTQKDRRLAQIKEDFAQKDRQLAQIKEDFTQKNRQLAQMKEDFAQKDRQLAEAKQEITKNNQTISGQIGHIQAISQSLSYRLGRLITSPLRWLYDTFLE